MKDKEDKYVPAKYQGGRLVPGTAQDFASKDQLLDIYNKRIVPLIVDMEGNVKTFEEAKINYDDYVSDYRKTGYYKEPWKLIYKVLPNSTVKEDNKKAPPEAYVFPVNGFGLWDAIYGYLAIKPDGDTVIGTSCNDQERLRASSIQNPTGRIYFPENLSFKKVPMAKQTLRQPL